MTNNAYDVRSYRFLSTDRILLDANIWLYLYAPATIAYPPHVARAITDYTRAWGLLHDSGALAFMDTLVLSEVINRLIDNEWQRIDPPDSQTRQRRYQKRKHFRKSADYAAAARSVEQLAKAMLAEAECIDHPLSCWDVETLLTTFGSGSTDWNDQLLARTCLHHGMKLLTHDGDHVHGGIEVLTANSKLIEACR